MDNATQETTTETVQLSLTDENISQADWDSLRDGKTVEVEKSAPVAKAAKSETVDESDTSETDDEGDEESSDEESLEARPKKKSGTQRRIEKLVKQRAKAEEEREYWRQEALKSQGKTQEPPKVEVKATTEGKPSADTFETHEDYILALAEWKADEKIKAAKDQERQEKLKAEQETRTTAFQGKVQEFKKAHDDFDDVITDVDDIPMSLAVSQAILDSEDGPALMYELAKKPEEYARICALPALAAARAIGRFEAGLAKSSEEKKPEVKTKTTKAPPPARPVSATSANGKKTLHEVAESGSQAEYDRMRAEQEKRRANI